MFNGGLLDAAATNCPAGAAFAGDQHFCSGLLRHAASCLGEGYADKGVAGFLQPPHDLQDFRDLIHGGSGLIAFGQLAQEKRQGFLVGVGRVQIPAQPCRIAIQQATSFLPMRVQQAAQAL